MNLARAFAASADKNRAKTAVFWGDAEYSYDKLRAQSCWLSARLQQDCGIGPGDRVGLWLKNCPEFIAATFGALHAGAIVVPINNFLKNDEVSYILADAGVKVLISEAATAGDHSELAARAPGLKFFRVDDLAEMPARPEVETAPVARRETDLALIIYTSGTTGRPKGGMLSHGNVLSNI